MNQPKVTVIGSINMDLFTTVDELPQQGETIFGKDYFMTPGGKGANQAIAAAKLGADVCFLGKVGKDLMGKKLLNYFEEENFNYSMIEIDAEASTGIANVILNNKDNRIMVVPGANSNVTVDFIKKYKHRILTSDVILAQLEIPIETVEWCANLCARESIPFILNPAPSRALSSSLIENCTYITPNEEEARKVFSIEHIVNDYSSKLITTLGPRGAMYNGTIIPTYKSKVTDTTGAGDTFNGALAYFLGSGYVIEEAITHANIAASYSVEYFGAQQGMPSYDQVKQRYRVC
ncbi:ribokinase [Halobacillus sp. Marseille-P3879]|uniref:ribokinase n=1 Tax=Halobacillus sp. Marseille-P3879 TaxID=2045014 RepID=UPI000C7C2664|nr:ribokinase [Halobacillus sp. Marseille-P3879]